MARIITIVFFLFSSFVVKAQSIQKFLDSLMRTNQIPEIGYAIISPDSILELKVLGFHRSDIQNEQTKATLTDYFHLGSNSKAITGFVAAYLVENNKIKWTTKFFDLFPEWLKGSNSAYASISLADLLSHRAHIQPYMSGLEYDELPEFKGNKSKQREQFAKYLLAEKPVGNNEKAYNYSNAGYSIAALMLEKVSGKSWEQLTKELMATKVKVNIEYGWPNKINLNQPYGHWIENDTLRPLPPSTDYNLSLAEPAGDICITLPDYAKFVQLQLQGLSGRDNVLKTNTYNYLHYGLKGYAIGWGNMNKDGKKYSEHIGSAGTFFCQTLINKTDKLALIVTSNSASPQAQKAILKFVNLLKNQYGI